MLLQDWSSEVLHLVYTFICFTLQYLIPCIVVGIIYTRVCCAFSANMSVSGINTNNRKLARRKKTNMMLIIVSLVFFLSWAPINLYNLVLDIGHPFKVPISPSDQRLMLAIYAGCHLLAMSTAVTNPVLYGFLNENFKQVRLKKVSKARL